MHGVTMKFIIVVCFERDSVVWHYTCKECHTTESISKHTTKIHKEREQSED